MEFFYRFYGDVVMAGADKSLTALILIEGC